MKNKVSHSNQIILALGLLFSISSFSQTQTFTTSGIFTVPAGVTQITIEAWGAGGAGGGTTTNNARGGGGGAGGAYAIKTLTGLTPSTNYTVSVGGTTNGSNSSGANGNPSWFGNTSTLYAQGGAGGAAPNGGTVSGGTGSAALSIGDTTFAGGNGANGTSSRSGGGGGGAGSGGSGGNASGTTRGPGTANGGGNGGNGITNEGNGSAGNTYGGGGSGAYLPDNTNHSGGDGAPGRVIVTWTAPAEINIRGNGNNINDGDVTPSVTDDTDFGNVDISAGSVVHTFTIQNTGTVTLTVGAISITGANPSDFTITSSPAVSVSGSSSTTFNITFNPSALGLRTASVSIANNDSDENPYNFDIQGTGVIPTYSEVIVSVNWPSWSSENRVRVYDPSGTLLATIDNGYSGCCDDSYSTSLNLGCILDTSNYYLVMYDSYGDGWNGAGSNVTVTSGGSTVLTDTGSGTNPGGTAANFNVSGGGSCASAAEIDIQGNSNSINTGDTTPSATDDTDFGSADVSSGTVVKTFTIENTGTSSLTIGAITFSGANASDFSITTSPAASVSALGTTTFNVTFNPSAIGTRTASISIVNDDSDENPYVFDIQGTGTTAAQEINIIGNGNSILDEDITPNTSDDTDFGSTDIASGLVTNIFIIENLGTLNTLNLFGASPYVVISGPDASDFSVTAIPTSSVSASSNTAFSITFNPTTVGLKTATITILNNDLDESTYNFDIQGTGAIIRGPGGVDTNLELWLKGTDGLGYSNGQPVSLWQDQTSNGYDAYAPVAGVEPTYRDDPAYNINFNPVVDFNNNYSSFTLDSDFSFDDTSTEFLQGTGGFYSQDVFVVLIPDTTVNNSFGSMDVFCADENFATNETDATGIGLGAYSVRFTGEILSYAHGTTSGGLGYGVAETTAGSTYSNAGIINVRNNIGISQQELYYNAINKETVQNDIPDFANINNARYWIGRSEGWEATTDARIAEIITYSSRKSDADLTQERNRIQSYLAIKYGITLGTNGTTQDYVDSSGNVLWNQSANTGYNYDIAGIGRDDVSSLNQKQSRSINNATDGIGRIEGILTIGLSDIYNTNNLNKSSNPTAFNDKEFLVWGNNGADLNLAATAITVNMSAGIVPTLITNVSFTDMQRVWKVVENGGDIPACKVRISQSSIRNITPPGSYLMFISDTGVFDPTADYRVMTSDGSGNLETTYDFDGTKYITFGYAPQVIAERSIQFDGIQDYIDVENNLDLNTTEFTISAWVKRNTGSVNASIISKRDAAYTEGYDFKINGSGYFEFDLNGGIVSLTSSVAIPENEWHQLAVIYNAGNATLYIDGVADTSASSLPAPVATSQSFYIAAAGKNTPTAFFGGNIDEVRMWNRALSISQLHYIMNQEIENIATSVDGTSIPTSITKNEVQPIPWADLAGYYPMSIFTYTNTNDESGNNHQGALRHLDTVDRQTAPLPYKSQADGDWTTDATWLNYTVQTLPNDVSIIDGTTPINWNIVETNHNINIDTYSNLGRERQLEALTVNSGTLTVNGNTATNTGNGLTITHYLKLDGTIDLEGESQLIQSTDSDFDATSSGTLQRDQQGNSNTYLYNYWSSPVAPTSNSSYTLPNVITNVGFLTSGYNGSSSPVKNADYWIWKYANKLGDKYSLWQHVRSTGSLLAGEGYTMKGPGTATPDQNYILKGQPNNGTINLTINAGNEYLIGNPYASAIDADEFIKDNISIADGGRNTTGNIINGALYFWDHFANNTHTLAAYQGGYATYTLMGGTKAISNDTRINASGAIGTKAPERYIPVAQGFFVSAMSDASLTGLSQPIVGGTIQFKNSQRIFKKEIISGTNSGSLFLKSNSKTNVSKVSDSEIDTRQKIRLMFDSPNGYHRQLLVGVDTSASNNFDLGYDAPLNETNKEDMYWDFNDSKFIIQAVNNFDSEQALPIGIKTNKAGISTIKIDKIENMDMDKAIFIHDIDLNKYHNLKESNFEVFLNPGDYVNRFEIVFSNTSKPALSLDNMVDISLEVYFSNEKESIIINNPTQKNIESVKLYNILGQSIYQVNNNTNENYLEFKTKNIKSGAYILNIKTNEGTATKKVLIK